MADLEATTATADSPDNVAVVQDSPSGDESTPKDSREDSVDSLKVRLQERDKTLEQAQKDYKELQSVSDRHYNQLTEKLAKLEGKLEGASTSRATEQTHQADRAAWDKFCEDLAEKAEEHPKEIVKVLRDLVPAIRDEVRRDAVREAEEKFRPTFQSFDTRFRELDPVRRENKETLDKLIAAGFSDDDAMKAINALGKQRSVSQPGDVQPPGRTTQSGGNGSGAGKKFALPKFDPQTAETISESFRMLGISDKRAESILLNTAKSLAEK